MREEREVLFGRYRVEELLGRGGMGEVHRAHDTEHDRVVALKRLSVSLGDDQAAAEAKARFRRESRIAAELRDPHVVTVYDYGEVDGRLYLAMRLVEGTDLRKLLDAGPVPPERALAILSQIAGALDTAHAAGVVHRDVKPSNILLDESDTAYLADFGIAKSLSPDATSVTGTGEIGTLDYMAPERLMHRGADHRADVYSLACVLFECLTGRKPFPADDSAGKLAAQLNDPPPAPSLFDWRIPRAVDLIVATGMDKDPERRYPNAGELMTAATTAFQAQSMTAPLTTPELADNPSQGTIMDAIVRVATRGPARAGGGPGDECPYPGLRSFSATDTGVFYGREHSVTDVLVRLARQSRDSGPLLVVGASGTGKSSLLRAGVLPALATAEQPWPQVVTTPGPNPIGTLAARLAPLARADADGLARWLRARPAELGRLCGRVAHEQGGEHGRLLIMVDQFEELFTAGVDPGSREAFATMLANAWPALVVLAIRADFIDQCLRLGALGSALSGPYPLGRLSSRELERVILEPAHAVGLRVEDGLADRLITDIGAGGDAGYDPGALPRLAHALRETWQHRSDGVLTLKGYQDTGGVDRAVALTADGVYHRLSGPDRELLRLGLLRMVAVLDGGGVARRKARREEIPGHLLARLVEARLVTAEADGVQLSHDALLTAWPRLREWVEQDRQGLVLRQHLGQAAASWAASGHDDGELYRGARLAATLEWAAGRVDLTDGERGFLRESRRVQQRGARRLRTLVTGLAVFLVVAVVAGVIAAVKWGDATTEADHAERAARESTSRQLAAESLVDADTDPLGARRKALDAWHTSETAQARGALLSNATYDYPVTFDSGLGEVFSLDVSPNGRLVAAGDPDGHLAVLDTRTRKPIDAKLSDNKKMIFDVEFSPDGSMLATASDDANGVRIWEMPSGRLLRTLPASGIVAWRPDGKVIAAHSARAIGAWDLRTGDLTGWLTAPHQTDQVPLDIAYSPDGKRLAVGLSDGVVELWDPARRKLIHSEDAHRKSGPADPTADLEVAFSGRLLASASSRDGNIRFADSRTGAPQGEAMYANFGGGRGMAFTSDGGHLLTLANIQGGVARWNVATRQRAGTYAEGVQGNSTGLMSVALSNRGDVVAGRLDGGIVLWPRNPGWSHAATDKVHRVTFSSDGKKVSSFTAGGVYTWDPAKGKVKLDNGHPLPPFGVGYLPDGGQVVGYLGGTVTVTNADGADRSVDMRRTDFLAGDVAVSPDGSMFALLTVGQSADNVAENRTTMYVYDTATLELRATINLGTDTALEPVFSPDGDTLYVTASRLDDENDTDNEIRRWRTSDFRALDAFPANDSRSRVVPSPDGATLIVHSAFGIQVLDARTGKVVREFGEHPSYVTALALSPDGRTVATGTVSDPTIRLWDLASGALVATLTGHEGGVNDLEFSPRGDRLASASSDAGVGVWPVHPDDAVRQVCDDLADAGERNLTALGCTA